MGQVCRPVLVVIAPDNVALPCGPQGLHDGRSVEVPGMDDYVRPVQQGFDLLPEQAVGIG